MLWGHRAATDGLAPAHLRLGAGATAAPGERRTDHAGPGLEFIDHRPYRPGDDIRDLDHRLMARLGQPYLRNRAADLRLPVSILLDDSASMAAGPGRYAQAQDLARLLGFVALAGGDALRLWRGTAPPSPQFAGLQRADALAAWLALPRRGEAPDFAATLRAARPRLPGRGVVVLISDWLDAAAIDGLAALVHAGHEPVVIRLSSRAEADPARLGQGALVLHDAETGADLALTLTPALVSRYGALRAARTARLQALAGAGGGRFFDLAEGTVVVDALQGPMRAAGLLV